MLNYCKGKQFGGEEPQAFLCLFYFLVFFASSFSAENRKYLLAPQKYFL